MRLPANGRRWLETACRTAAFAIVALLLARSLRSGKSDTPSEGTTVGISDMARVTKENVRGPLQFVLRGTPTQTERAWQKAIREAGSEISWNGQLTPIAIATRPIGSPLGGHMVSVGAPQQARLLLRDDISIIDSLDTPNGAAALPISVGGGSVRAVAGSDSAFAALSDPPGIRRVLVLGKAGWETKFLVTALEESGWTLDARIPVAPNVVVNQGAATIDTAHYAAVIALDESAAPRARDISAFVRSGGGLVLGPYAARSEAFAGLRISSPRSIPENLDTEDSVSHSTAHFGALQLPPDAVPIERNRNGVSVAAMRVAFGRVIQIGYTETWRWRLQGNVAGKSEHGDWWTQILSQVVFTNRSASTHALADPAPYADLIDIAGPAVPALRSPAPLTSQSGQVLWILLLLALLVTEWASRRLRGAR